MRKWMRERLQRRKKKPAEPTDQPAPPPLQPAYFDADQPPSAPAQEKEISREPEPPAPREPEPESAPEPRPRSRTRSAQTRSAPTPPASAEAAEAPSDPESVAIPYQVPHAIDPLPPGDSAPRARGRRRRGGRGRSTGRGREQAVAQAFTPAAVKGIVPAIPVVPEDVQDEEQPADIGEPETAASPAPQARIVPTVVPSATPSAPQRAPKGIVVLAIGLPGSGKSSWFKRHNVVPLSSDMVRSLLFDDVREQRFQDLVFSNLRSMLKARLIAKRPTNYVDATNLTPQERSHWIKLARDYHYEVHAVFFDVPLDVCLERHQRRDRVVPEDVMRRMAAKLKAPAFEEGFAKITVVRVKKKDDAAPSD